MLKKFLLLVIVLSFVFLYSVQPAFAYTLEDLANYIKSLFFPKSTAPSVVGQAVSLPNCDINCGKGPCQCGTTSCSSDSYCCSRSGTNRIDTCYLTLSYCSQICGGSVSSTTTSTTIYNPTSTSTTTTQPSCLPACSPCNSAEYYRCCSGQCNLQNRCVPCVNPTTTSTTISSSTTTSTTIYNPTSTSTTSTTISSECKDTDKGDDPENPGTTSKGGMFRNDQCMADELFEYYCGLSTRDINSKKYSCNSYCTSKYNYGGVCQTDKNNLGYCLCKKSTTKCRAILQNGPTSQKIDLTFVMEQVSEPEAASQWNALKNFDPYSSYQSKFNVWYVDEPMSFGCRQIGNRFSCNDQDVVSFARNNCPSDYIIGITSQWIRAYSNPRYSLLYASANDYDAIAHEFGHAFGGLADEYQENGLGSNPQHPNCAPDSQTAQTWWGDLVGQYGIGYYLGCSYAPNAEYPDATNIRPTEGDCQMRNNPGHYCQVCKREVERKLQGGVYSSAVSASDQPVPEKVYAIDVNYNGGVMFVNNFSVESGFVPDRNIQLDFGERLDMVSTDNSILQSFKFSPPTEVFYDYLKPDGSFSGGMITKDDVNFTLLMPYSDNSNLINLYTPQNIKTTFVDVSNFEQKQLAIAGSACQSGGNCSLDAIGNCTDGLWIVMNKEGKPLQIPVVNNLSYKIQFSLVSSGKVGVYAICFEPEIKVQKTVIDVE